MLRLAGRSATLRVVIVLILGGFAIFNAAFDFTRIFGHPLGDYGFATDGTRITRVNLGSPSARAGLRAGDVISLAHNSDLLRNFAFRGIAPSPGAVLHVSVFAPHRRDVSVVAVAEPSTNFPYLFVRQTLYIICILVGALLLLKRPGVSTWALFLYSLGAVVEGQAVLSATLFGTPLYGIRNALYSLFVPASTFGLILFVLTAAHRPLRVTDKVIIGIAAALALANGIVHAGQPPVFGMWTYGQTAAYASAITLLAYLFAVVSMPRTYRLSGERSRARLQWIALGVIFSALAIATKELGVTSFNYATISVLDTVPITVFATSAYALLRERIVDVNFAVSRALVYAILTSVTVGILALIDWFVSERLQQVRLGFLLEVFAALGLGFAIQHMHRWSDAIVDRYVFRAVHEAELALKRLGNAIAHAPSSEAIDRLVCQDATRVMSLASAAVFHLAGDEGFVRTASSGWPGEALERIGIDHRIALYLNAEERPIIPDDVFDDDDILPKATARPALAVPCIARHELIAFALFGSHKSGAQPDVKDVELLREFVDHATAAYEHAAVLDLTNKVRTLRTENGMLRSLLPESASAPEKTSI